VLLALLVRVFPAVVIDGAEAGGVQATSAYDARACCVPALMPSVTALVILAAILSSKELAFSLLSLVAYSERARSSRALASSSVRSYTLLRVSCRISPAI
jgi:nucleoside recognition membrane protein YjiH